MSNSTTRLCRHLHSDAETIHSLNFSRSENPIWTAFKFTGTKFVRVVLWTKTRILWGAKFQKSSKTSEFQAFFDFFSILMGCKVCKKGSNYASGTNADFLHVFHGFNSVSRITRTLLNAASRYNFFGCKCLILASWTTKQTIFHKFAIQVTFKTNCVSLLVRLTTFHRIIYYRM